MLKPNLKPGCVETGRQINYKNKYQMISYDIEINTGTFLLKLNLKNFIIVKSVHSTIQGCLHPIYSKNWCLLWLLLADHHFTLIHIMNQLTNPESIWNLAKDHSLSWGERLATAHPMFYIDERLSRLSRIII